MKTPDWVYLVLSEHQGQTTVLNVFYDGKAAEQNAKEYQETFKKELIYVSGRQVRKDNT